MGVPTQGSSEGTFWLDNIALDHVPKAPLSLTWKDRSIILDPGLNMPNAVPAQYRPKVWPQWHAFDATMTSYGQWQDLPASPASINRTKARWGWLMGRWGRICLSEKVSEVIHHSIIVPARLRTVRVQGDGVRDDTWE